MVTGFFLILLQGVFPLFFPLPRRNVLNEAFHVVRAALFHLFRHMPVNVQRKGCCRMSEIPLHGLDIVTGMDRGNCVAVAKIVETSLRHANRCDNALVAVIHIVR